MFIYFLERGGSGRERGRHRILSRLHAPSWANNLPTVCLRCSSDCCFHAVCQTAVCPTFSPKAVPMPLGSPSTEAHWPLELQASSLAACQKSWNSGPLVFQANCYGDSVFLCTPLCVSLSPFLVHDCSSLSVSVATICFSSKLYLYTSSLLWCGLFSAFSCKVCSATL